MELKRFEYPLEVEWTGGASGREGELIFDGKPRIKVATPPEFRGPEGFISPEDLYVASAAVCLMSTFISMSSKVRANWTSYRNHAVGILQQDTSGDYIFTEINLDVYITIPTEEMITRVEKALELTKKHCLVTNSMKTEVKIIPHIRVEA
ncbi:MAG: OsmC family protein [Candidatus Hodarchaeota archaeon]